MNSDFTEILGVQVSTLDEDLILEYTRKYLARNEKNDVKPLVIFTPNPEIVVYARKDEKFKSLVNTAQINLCDGFGLVWASQVLGKPRLRRITGADFAEKLVKLAADLGVGIGLIGGRPGVAVRALECLKKKYPGLKGWGEERISFCHSRGAAGQPREDWIPDQVGDDILKRIQETKPGLVLVGLGAPKQEYFINLLTTNYHLQTTPIVFMAVGGAFDFWAGRVRRAPKFLQNLGLEWAWRLILQPWRLKRQLSLLKFIRLVYTS